MSMVTPPGFTFRAPARRFSVSVYGTCMEPRIPDDSMVIVNTRRKPRHGRAVMFERFGGFFVKEYREEHGCAWLVALDGSVRWPVDERVHIIGCIDWVLSKTKPNYYRDHLAAGERSTANEERNAA